MNTSPQHHPDKNLLVEFAAGCLERAPAIAVSIHLQYCNHCRHEISQLEQVGAALLSLSAHEHDETLNEAQETNDAFNALMAKIDQGGIGQRGIEKQHKEKQVTDGAHHSIHENHIPQKYATLPKIVKKMMEQKPITWKKVTANLRSASLVAGQDKYAVSLQKIKASGQVPEHEHRGSEITVVLKGSFSDEDNIYQEGDFLLKNSGDKHRPMASSNEDCLCLSVEQAPVKLTGLFARLFNPFIRITAA